MIIHGIFIYSLSVVFDSASYIKTFGLTDTDLSQSIIYKVAIFAVLVAIASGGEKLLFKISGPMVVVKVGIIIIFGFAMVPHWNFSNISAFPEASVFFRDVLLTIPFCFFSAVFIQVLNPMNIAYRKRVADRVLATRMAIRTHRISYITLIAVILFSHSHLPFRLATKRPFQPSNRIFLHWLWRRRSFWTDYSYHLNGAKYLRRINRVLWYLFGIPRGD